MIMMEFIPMGIGMCPWKGLLAIHNMRRITRTDMGNILTKKQMNTRTYWMGKYLPMWMITTVMLRTTVPIWA